MSLKDCVKEHVLREHIIEEFIDEPIKKEMLYGITTITELMRAGLLRYKKMKSGSRPNLKMTGKYPTTKTQEGKGTMRCFGKEHTSTECPIAANGPSISLNRVEYDHRSNECPIIPIRTTIIKYGGVSVKNRNANVSIKICGEVHTDLSNRTAIHAKI